MAGVLVQRLLHDVARTRKKFLSGAFIGLNVTVRDPMLYQKDTTI